MELPTDKDKLKCKECGIDLGPLEINTFCGRCEACDERWCGFFQSALTGLVFGTFAIYASGGCVDFDEDKGSEKQTVEAAARCANASMKARRGK